MRILPLAPVIPNPPGRVRDLRSPLHSHRTPLSQLQLCPRRRAGPLRASPEGCSPTEYMVFLWFLRCLRLRRDRISPLAFRRATFPARRLLRSPLRTPGREGGTTAFAQLRSERGLGRQPRRAGKPRRSTNASPAAIRRWRRASSPRRCPLAPRRETSPTTGRRTQERGTRRAGPRFHRGHTSGTGAIELGHGGWPRFWIYFPWRKPAARV
jgi:hypothetical protein